MPYDRGLRSRLASDSNHFDELHTALDAQFVDQGLLAIVKSSHAYIQRNADLLCSKPSNNESQKPGFLNRESFQNGTRDGILQF